MAVSSSPYATRSPTLEPSGGVKGSTVVCASFDAQSSMPFDLMPRMLRGFRLQRTMTSRSCMEYQEIIVLMVLGPEYSEVIRGRN